MSGHHPFDQLRARMTPERQTHNAAQTQVLLAALPQQALQHAQAHALAELTEALQGHDEAASTLLSSTRRICISAPSGGALKPWAVGWRSWPISRTAVSRSRSLARGMQRQPRALPGRATEAPPALRRDASGRPLQR